MFQPAFHIHVDAQTLTLDFEQLLRGQLGFILQNFLHDHVEVSYEPAYHLTARPKNSQEFKTIFGQVKEYVESHPGALTGYIEGECIPEDIDLVEKPFDPSIKLLFKVSCTQLPPGKFREDEIHVSLARDESDPRLLQALTAMGLFVGYLPKKQGVAAIYTVQGSRQHISELMPALTYYLQRAGGGVRCSIKEERIADSWMSSPDIRLPPVIDKISWL